MSAESEEFNLATALSTGTWILIPYGYKPLRFCVIERTENMVLLGRKSWCVSAAIWFTIKELEEIDGEILGRGKRRWWRSFVPFPNDLIFPYGSYQ